MRQGAPHPQSKIATYGRIQSGAWRNTLSLDRFFVGIRRRLSLYCRLMGAHDLIGNAAGLLFEVVVDRTDA